MKWFISIVSVIVSAVLSILLADEIKSWIKKALLRIGLLKDVDIAGKWVAVFSCGGKNYREIIEIKQRKTAITGRIIPDTRNYKEIRKSAEKKPLRLKGNIIDNRYITGFWYHPITSSRYYGSFQLILDNEAENIRGKWIGFTRTSDTIECGDWVFKKDDMSTDADVLQEEPSKSV